MPSFLLLGTGGHLLLGTGGKIIIGQTQEFEINGAVITHVNRANWVDRLTSQALDGVNPLRASRTHTWAADAMPASIFDLLTVQEGAIVRLRTTNYSDRNGDYAEYPGTVLQSVAAQHAGPEMSGVLVTFLVRI